MKTKLTKTIITKIHDIQNHHHLFFKCKYIIKKIKIEQLSHPIQTKNGTNKIVNEYKMSKLAELLYIFPIIFDGLIITFSILTKRVTATNTSNRNGTNFRDITCFLPKFSNLKKKLKPVN